MLLQSLSNEFCMKHTVLVNVFIKKKPFVLYEPSKCTIAIKQVVPDVICRWALKPW